MPVTLSPLKAAFANIVAALEAETINRYDEIDVIATALVARGHVFMLSQPGTGKTFLTDRLLARIDGAVKFPILLSKFTDDQAVFGPLSVPALREGRYDRLTKGYLPEADVAFIDEIWKGSSATTNALLGVMNERRMRVGDTVIDVPLSTVIAASNELPDKEHDECAAIYDRLHFRLEVAPLLDPDDLRNLLRLVIEANPQTLITWGEVLKAQDEAALIPVTDEAVDAIVDIAMKLRGHDVRPSGRRLRSTQDMARGAAWLAGADEVRPEHLEILRHMLWDTPAQKGIVERTVLEVSSPMQREIIEVADIVAGLSEGLDAGLKLDEADPARTQVILEIRKKTERAMGSAIDLEDRAMGRAGVALADTMRRMEKLHSTMAFELAGVTGTKSLADSIRADRRK